MSKKVTSFVAVILLVCFLFVFAFSFLSPFIAQATSTQDKINEKTQEKKELQEKIDAKEEEKEITLAKKQEIEEDITRVQGEIDKIQVEIDDLNGKISVKEKELKDAEEKSVKQYGAMKTRLRVMYEDNSTSYITMIFSNENINDILSYIEIIKQLLSYDNNMYNNLVATKEKIATIKEGLEKDRETVVAKQNVQKEKKAELDVKNEELQVIVDGINNDIEKYKEAYAQAEKEEAALKKSLSAELSKGPETPSGAPANYTGGKLTWPAPGYYTITSEYGYRHHPTLGVYKLHTGMDIGVPSGSKIVAAASGKVIKAQYNVAYGYYIVIDHGSGLSTLYAHNSKLLVSAGQSVSAGQHIANSGNTGYSTGPHCHFEVMVNGSTTNPRNYF